MKNNKRIKQTIASVTGGSRGSIEDFREYYKTLK